MKTLITLCARGGSKGIPGKNIKILNNKHLIAYSIDLAQKYYSRHHDITITLSTDCDNIKNIARLYDLHSDYKRPESLSDDKTGKISVIKDILLYEENKENIKFDYIIDLDITSPLRNIDDIENAFSKLIENKDAYNIFSVSPANRNPYFNMIEPTENNYCKLVKEGLTIKSRQTAPIVFDLNASFYIYRRRFFDCSFETAITEKSLYYVVPHMCFDLDHPNDFLIMEVLLKNNLLDFKL